MGLGRAVEEEEVKAVEALEKKEEVLGNILKGAVDLVANTANGIVDNTIGTGKGKGGKRRGKGGKGRGRGKGKRGQGIEEIALSKREEEVLGNIIKGAVNLVANTA